MGLGNTKPRSRRRIRREFRRRKFSYSEESESSQLSRTEYTYPRSSNSSLEYPPKPARKNDRTNRVSPITAGYSFESHVSTTDSSCESKPETVANTVPVLTIDTKNNDSFRLYPLEKEEDDVSQSSSVSRRRRTKTCEIEIVLNTDVKDDFDLASCRRKENSPKESLSKAISPHEGDEVLEFTSLKRPLIRMCSNCGSDISNTRARFCSDCGFSIIQESHSSDIPECRSPGLLYTPKSLCESHSSFLHEQDERVDSLSRRKRAYKRLVKMCPIEKGRLGMGTSGIVHKVIDIRSGQPLAVKEMYVDLQDPEEVSSIRKELFYLSTLHHPNIVEYLGCRIDEEKNGTKGRVLILMERLECGSFADLLNQFSLGIPEDAVRSLSRQLLEGIQYVHNCGVTHRDIKPANILLSSNGVIKITDFGSASIAASESDSKHDRLEGTPAYMPPETMGIMGKSDVNWLFYGKAHDIWSFGCCVHELLTGKAPWSDEKFESPIGLLMKIQNEEFPISTQISRIAQSFCKLCLQSDPQERQVAAELLIHPFLQPFDETDYVI